MDKALFNHILENQKVWAIAYNEQKKKYKYEKGKNEKLRVIEKKQAGLPVGQALLKI